VVAGELNLKETLLLQHKRDLESRGAGVTIMCVGESGVGKSSLISNIFTVPVARSAPPPTRGIVDKRFRLESDGVPLTVTFIDTPGYGDILELSQTFRGRAADLDRCGVNVLARCMRVRL